VAVASPKVNTDEAVAKRWEDHRQRLEAIRNSHSNNFNALLGRVQGRHITPEEFAARAKELNEDFGINLNAELDKAPDPAEGVSEFLEHCPWCQAKIDVAIHTLPDGQVEPQDQP
jgi:hypothetical protein